MAVVSPAKDPAADAEPPSRLPGRDPLLDFGDGRLTHLPGLDGLRGLAVAAIVVYHGNWSSVPGGWLGVPLFFVLSGFLITSLLLSEHQRTQRIALRDFWVRRFRRLLPAAWLTLALIVIALWFTGTGLQNESGRWDVVSALAQVANWRFWASGHSYAALFRAPSPVLHFWSLSLEEQFYVVFPAAAALLLALRRGRRWIFPGVLVVGIALSWTAPVLFHLSHDRTYYGTDTRAGELLVGALLAVVISHPRVRATLVRAWAWRTAIAAIGLVGLAALVAMWLTVQESSSFVTRGGLAAHATIATIVVVAAILPSGPVRWVCSLAPLRWLGRVSYGVYLVHWPLFVFLTQQRLHVGHLAQFVIVVSLSLGIAALSARYFERPIRENRANLGGLQLRPARLAPVAVVLIVASCLALPTSSASAQFNADTAPNQLKALHARSRAAAASSTTQHPGAAAVPPNPTWDGFGDSVALSLALLFGPWEKATNETHGIGGVMQLGCGIVRGGYRKYFGVEAIKPECDDWGTTWANEINATDPEIAVVESCQWELVDRKLAGDGVWRAIGDPVYDAKVESEFLAATDLLASKGALVVWLTCSQYGDADNAQLPADAIVSHQPARVDGLNAIIRKVVAERPNTTRLIDLGGWMSTRVDDTTLRSDGSHYDPTPQDDVVSTFLGPQLVSTWRSWWTATHH